MKRVIALFLCAMMLFVGFVGCDKKTDDDKDDNTDTEIEIPDGKESDNPADVVSFKSDHYTVDNNMLNYYFRYDFYDAIDNYFESYYQYYSLDPTKDLKEQNCKMYQESEHSWFEYFMTQTSSNIMNYLYFAEAALDKGNDTAPEITEKVEGDIAAIKSAAEYYGETEEEFIHTRFGETVTEDDIRRAATLYYTGTYQYDLDMASIKVTDSDIDKYYEENKNDFLYVDFRSYSFKESYTGTDEEASKVSENNKKLANELLATGNQDAFAEWILNYQKEINDTLETPLTEEEMEYNANKVTGEYEYNDSTAFGKWAFTSDRKAGDMTVLDNGQGTYTVYYIVKAPYRIEYKTVSISRILFDKSTFDDDEAKTLEKANEILAKWEASDKTEDAFNQIALEYDSGMKIQYDDITYADMESALSSWCYDESRKVGDCELVENTYGYYLVFFRGFGEEKWKFDVREKIETDSIRAIFDEYIDKYTVSMSENNVMLISGVTAYTSKDTDTTDTTAQDTTTVQ